MTSLASARDPGMPDPSPPASFPVLTEWLWPELCTVLMVPMALCFIFPEDCNMAISLWDCVAQRKGFEAWSAHCSSTPCQSPLHPAGEGRWTAHSIYWNPVGMRDQKGRIIMSGLHCISLNPHNKSRLFNMEQVYIVSILCNRGSRRNWRFRSWKRRKHFLLAVKIRF